MAVPATNELNGPVRWSLDPLVGGGSQNLDWSGRTTRVPNCGALAALVPSMVPSLIKPHGVARAVHRALS